jgi:glycosyltransferase involved in cell wall biosynthesis
LKTAVDHLEPPLVIVEMITYNHEKYIAQSIESVMMQQTTFSFILLICEDCSTDKTAALCQSYQSKYPNKIELHLNHQNLGVMQNAKKLHDLSFKRASKYIAMCDGDDYWTDPFKLQKQVDFLESNSNFSLVFHNTYDLSNGVMNKKYLTLFKDEFSIADFVLFLYARTVSILFRRPFDKLPREFEKIKIGDWALSIIVLQYGKAKYLDSCMSVYRARQLGVWGGNSDNKNTMAVFESFVVMKAIINKPNLNLIECKLHDMSLSYSKASLLVFDIPKFLVGLYYFFTAPSVVKKKIIIRLFAN